MQFPFKIKKETNDFQFLKVYKIFQFRRAPKKRTKEDDKKPTFP